MSGPGRSVTRRSLHPGLDLLLDKLHRRESLDAAELADLQGHLALLHGRGSGCDEPDGRAAPVRPATARHRGYATAEGTRRYGARLRDGTRFFRRCASGLTVGSVGIGTYRGAMNAAADDAYAEAVQSALSGGINLVDTSLNYRHGRSERSVARGLDRFLALGGTRDEVVLCTKGGYLVPGAFDRSGLDAATVVDGVHCIAPAFLADQLERSLRNLNVDTVDVYYVHNPEVQLAAVSPAELMTRLRDAFVVLEQAAADGRIRYYGTATWSGYRDGTISLAAVEALARQVAGEEHRFRFVQLPVNLGMQEALWPRDGGRGVLATAAERGVTVVASASLMQARLAHALPPSVRQPLDGLDTDAQRALQFARSAPGVTSALVGMSDVAHVRENLALATVAPMTPPEHARLAAATNADRPDRHPTDTNGP